ncbi:MAG: hypothetical protein NZ530_03505 [Thermodesulfobacteriaceae bacterium]|nr:hypothetical protein [Thermodesulfobacteriaceae bacterium]MCX8041094.1 hypothetical protein [Thermodesulfobacteriaceae bacterium]MDW8135535.1 hypothetical protein [Thermodesulfobacterium sp.]
MKEYFKFIKYFLLFIFWFLFSLRTDYPTFSKNIWETLRLFFSSGLFGLGLTVILNGLRVKFGKTAFSRYKFLEIFLWLSLITAATSFFEHYFKIGSKFK